MKKPIATLAISLGIEGDYYAKGDTSQPITFLSYNNTDEDDSRTDIESEGGSSFEIAFHHNNSMSDDDMSIDIDMIDPERIFVNRKSLFDDESCNTQDNEENDYSVQMQRVRTDCVWSNGNSPDGQTGNAHALVETSMKKSATNESDSTEESTVERGKTVLYSENLFSSSLSIEGLHESQRFESKKKATKPTPLEERKSKLIRHSDYASFELEESSSIDDQLSAATSISSTGKSLDAAPSGWSIFRVRFEGPCLSTKIPKEVEVQLKKDKHLAKPIEEQLTETTASVVSDLFEIEQFSIDPFSIKI